jgi:hypothetical protein
MFFCEGCKRETNKFDHTSKERLRPHSKQFFLMSGSNWETYGVRMALEVSLEVIRYLKIERK